MVLKGIAEKVFLDRYTLKDKKGGPLENKPEQMWRRVARGVAEAEEKNKKRFWEKKFYQAMADFKYVPGGRILAGAGTGYQVTYYNCFVIPSPKDSRDGILETLKRMVEIMAHGGGVGINISSLRPRGFRVRKVNGFSSGPVNWAELFSVATKDIIQQGGSRRGALMLMLWDWHPDIMEFITVKQNLAKINGANLSVAVSDQFMEAVRKDKDWNLVFPVVTSKKYDQEWNGDLVAWQKAGGKVEVAKTIKARKLWDLIAASAWRSAEPGVVFMERYNKFHNNWYWNRINCVNPCVTGETLVNTTKGLKTISELYQNQLPFRVVVNGKDYLSSAVKLTGIKPVYKLTTKEGYTLRLTKDHEVYTTQGKKPAGSLKRGEKILLSYGGKFGQKGTYEQGLVLGWLVGDGAMKKKTAALYFYHEEKRELAPRFASFVQQMVTSEGLTSREYKIAPQYVEAENKAVIESVRLFRIIKRYGLTHENKYQVPENVWEGSQALQTGFLKALFSADGTVVGTNSKGLSVRLTSVSLSLLTDVQRLLLNLGIVSKLYQNRRPAMNRLLPNGKGGHKLYPCQAYHELVISKNHLSLYANLIGFLQIKKQEKLEGLLSNYRRGPYQQEYQATFSKLVKDSTEKVYDITVEDIHQFSANGLLVSNCGEEGLPPWGVCNLGSINLSALVKQPKGFKKPGKFDFKTLKETVKTAVRFQDNVVQSDTYIFEGIKKIQLEGERRIGLGTMGLGDTLIKMQLRYGSEKSLKLVDKIYRTIRDAAYEASADLAKEKGFFPKFDKKLYLKGKFIQLLPDKIKNKISQQGIRNSLLLMQAPTGSTSLMAGTTSGIEPVYEFEFVRRDRLGEHIIRHPLYAQWLKEQGIVNGEVKAVKRPDYFVTANNLSPEDHVKVQAVIQKYVDASISKTVNAPNSHTVEEVKKVYNLAYDLGLKGIAYMRDGSRPGVLSRESDVSKKEPASQKPTLSYEIMPRPVMIKGATYQIDTPVGRAFITINTDENGEPFEVFVNIGKAGTDVFAMAEGLGRVISTLLRLNSPLSGKKKLNLVIEQLNGIGGAKTLGFGDKKIRSLPDAVAKVLGKHFALNVNNGNGEVKKITETKQESLLTLEAEAPRSNFDICPQCGVASFAYEEGCKKCYSCGYSECG